MKVLSIYLSACILSLALMMPGQAHPPIPLRGKDAVVQTTLEKYPYVVENPGGTRAVYILIPVNDPWSQKLLNFWPQINKTGLEIRWVNILGEKPPTAADLSFISEMNLKRNLTQMQEWYKSSQHPSPSTQKSTPENVQALKTFKVLEQTIQPRVLRHGTLYHYPAILWMDGTDMIYYTSAAFPETLAELQLVLDDIRLDQKGWREFTNNPDHLHH